MPLRQHSSSTALAIACLADQREAVQGALPPLHIFLVESVPLLFLLVELHFIICPFTHPLPFVVQERLDKFL